MLVYRDTPVRLVPLENGEVWVTPDTLALPDSQDGPDLLAKPAIPATLDSWDRSVAPDLREQLVRLVRPVRREISDQAEKPDCRVPKARLETPERPDRLALKERWALPALLDHRELDLLDQLELQDLEEILDPRDNQDRSARLEYPDLKEILGRRERLACKANGVFLDLRDKPVYRV